MDTDRRARYGESSYVRFSRPRRDDDRPQRWIDVPEQWSMLRDLGCQHGQGFYFAKPIAAQTTIDYLRAQAGVSPAHR